MYSSTLSTLLTIPLLLSIPLTNALAIPSLTRNSLTKDSIVSPPIRTSLITYFLPPYNPPHLPSCTPPSFLHPSYTPYTPYIHPNLLFPFHPNYLISPLSFPPFSPSNNPPGWQRHGIHFHPGHCHSNHTSPY